METCVRDKYIKKCKGLKWRIEYVDNLLSLTNYALFDMVVEDNRPDDWDGWYTERGKWKAKISYEIFTDRMINKGVFVF